MDEDIIEIEQIEDGYVVLAIPALRLVVMGRTLDEARAWARSAIAYRGLSSSGPRTEPSVTIREEPLNPSSNAA